MSDIRLIFLIHLQHAQIGQCRCRCSGADLINPLHHDFFQNKWYGTQHEILLIGHII